ncbi:MAG: hypothetical protein ACRDLS_12470, partial [Solirubrobacteraceae bacterium]
MRRLIAARSGSIVRSMRAAALLALCPALLLVGVPVPAQAQGEFYSDCEQIGSASRVQVAGTTCESVKPLVEALLAAAPGGASAVLAAAGWAPL